MKIGKSEKEIQNRNKKIEKRKSEKEKEIQK